MNTDTAGILTDEQLAELGRIVVGCHKIDDAIKRINALALHTGFDLRLMPEYHPILMCNDISRIMYAHGQAEKRIRDAAFAAVEAKK